VFFEKNFGWKGITRSALYAEFNRTLTHHMDTAATDRALGEYNSLKRACSR